VLVVVGRELNQGKEVTTLSVGRERDNNNNYMRGERRGLIQGKGAFY